MMGWIRQLLGREDSDPDFSQYELFEIGRTMCQNHENASVRHNDVRFGEYSMDVVLRDAYSDVVEITPGMIHDLDRLLAESEPSFIARKTGQIEEDKVHQFRQLFFDQFSEDAIQDVLGRLYFDAREDFALDEIVGSETTNNHVFRYHIREPQEAQLAMSDEQMPMQTAQFHEESVDMKKTAARLHLAESPIASTVEELVEVEAGMLWDEIDVTDESDALTTDDEIGMSMVEAHIEIKEELGNPDTIVASSDTYSVANAVHGTEITVDGTGVMDVPFIVADSDRLGYRVTQQPLSVERSKDGIEPYVYRMQWNGNYIVTDDDVVCGPR